MTKTTRFCVDLLKMPNRGAFSIALLVLGFTASSAAANEWHVAVSGSATNPGTRESPWDLESTLQGKQKVRPGDIVWISGGTYKHPDRKPGTMGFAVRLAGVDVKPIEVRGLPGQRVTIDGGLNVQLPSTHLWLRDLEILVSENLARSRRFEETGSSPRAMTVPGAA